MGRLSVEEVCQQSWADFGQDLMSGITRKSFLLGLSYKALITTSVPITVEDRRQIKLSGASSEAGRTLTGSVSFKSTWTSV